MDNPEINPNENIVNMLYNQVEAIPANLYGIVSEYERNKNAEQNHHDEVVSSQRKEYETTSSALNRKKEGEKKTATNAHDNTIKKINESRNKMSQAKTNYSKVEGTVPERYADSALRKLLNRVRKTKENNEQKFNELSTDLLKQENEIHSRNLAQIQAEYEDSLSKLTVGYHAKESSEVSRHDEQMLALDEQLNEQFIGLNTSELQKAYEKLRAIVPKNQNYETAKEMPETLEIGYTSVNLDQWVQSEYSNLAVQKIQDYFGFALSETDSKRVLFPCGRSFQEQMMNKLITYHSGTKEEALEYLRALEMRMFMSIPCGKLHVTMFDPVNLGSNFSMFSSLGDHDERIISSKIWSDTQRMKEQLSELITQISHVNQDCLRNDYQNIVEYNRVVGKNAEPLQALFIADFPQHFDKEACELLEQVVSSGPKCGVYTFIAADETELNNVMEAYGLQGIIREMECFSYRESKKIAYQKDGMNLELFPLVLPEKVLLDEIFEALKNGIRTSDRITIYYDEISDNLTQDESKWFHYSEEDGLDIPIGLEGASRTVQLHLGGRGTKQHALISGLTGAGKSALVHTIIMSILLRYSPEDVQLFFLDFKRGLESNTYGSYNLPNFRVISLDTEPEFGLEVLKFMDEELAYRSHAFHGVDEFKIESYNELAERSNGEIEKFPRYVLVIDEFHEMFKDEGSDIAKQCELYLERIIKQGRAYGIHVILASQVAPENLQDIYQNIMNRIVLQSTASGLNGVIDGDSKEVQGLVNVDAGKGIFNDAGGDRDHNHLFRVAFFPAEQQKELLGRIKHHQEEIFGDLGYPNTRLLLSNIQDNQFNPLNQFVKTGTYVRDTRLGCPIYLGDEIAIENTFDLRLLRRRAQNVLICGEEYFRANTMISFAAMSILYNSVSLSSNHELPEEPLITYFDFAKTRSFGRRPTRNNFDMMSELQANFPDSIRIFGKESLRDGIETLVNELEVDNPVRQHYVIFSGLNRAKRMLDAGNGYERPLKQIFAELIKNGPEKGMNFIVWANEPGTFLSFYGDLLGEFDYRIVYNLKDEEYEQIVGSATMTTAYGNNVIFFDPDDENKKIRIYSTPLTDWFKKFMQRLHQPEESRVTPHSSHRWSPQNTEFAAYTEPANQEEEDDFGEFGNEFDDEF